MITSLHSAITLFPSEIHDIRRSQTKWGIVAKLIEFGNATVFLPYEFDTEQEAIDFIKAID